MSPTPQPLNNRIINSEMINIRETMRSIDNYNNILTDAEYENFILYNLKTNSNVNDISININSIPSRIPSYDNINVIVNNTDEYDLNNNIIINNNDEYIKSEKFAMDIKYTGATLPSTTVTPTTIINNNAGGNINSNTTLIDDTISLYQSTLKFEYTLNSDKQYTTDSSWNTYFNRNVNNMNYFAVINSNLNTNDNSYPFYISPDLSNNQYSFICDGKYFTRDNNNNKKIDNNFLNDMSKNTLLNNGLDVQILPLSEYSIYNDGSEFCTYKIVQNEDIPNISLNININNGTSTIGSNISQLKDKNLNDVSVNSITFIDISKCINNLHSNNSDNIEDGFTATLRVGYSTTGGYTCHSNSFLSLDDNDLTSNYYSDVSSYLNYFTNNKPNEHHHIDISNGSVIIDPVNTNKTWISLSPCGEQLTHDVCDISGIINIKQTSPDATDSTGRVTFLNNGNNPSNLTNKVSVYYNSQETPTNFTILSDNQCKVNNITYDVSFVVESTLNTVTNTYVDSRNLVKNSDNDARIVIANSIDNIEFDIKSNTSFNILEQDLNNKIRFSDSISIFNIVNHYIVVKDEKVYSSLDDNNNINETSGISDTKCNVKLQNTNITKLQDVDYYRLKLVTKTVNDLNTSLNPSNSWRFVTSDSGLICNPLFTSELMQDDAVFISGSSPVDISYTFYVEPTSTSLTSIKYYFDVALSDQSIVDKTSSSKFGGSNDISFEIFHISDNRVEFVDNNNLSGKNSTYENNKNNYIFEKWSRKKTYKAIINPSLPFYENLLLKTDLIYEEDIYYRGWLNVNGNKSNEVNTKQLEGYSINDKNLNIIDVKLYDSSNYSTIISPPSTTITLNPNDCYIFSVALQGISGVSWTDLTSYYPLDPFILYNTAEITYDQTFTCNASIQIPTNIIINSPTYYIPITNKTGSNINLTASLHTVTYSDISNNNDKLNYFTSSFSPYNVDLTKFTRSTTTYICDASLNNGTLNIEVSHMNGNTKYTDVIVNYPDYFALNLNIVHCPYNLISISRCINTTTTNIIDYTTRESNNKIVSIDSGVYLTLNNNVKYGYKEKFQLNNDYIKVKHINSNSYSLNNGDWSDYREITFNNSDNLTIDANGAKSIIFNRVRGYDMSYSTVYIQRIPATYTFVLDATSEAQQYKQQFTGAGVVNISNLLSQNAVTPNNGLTWNSNTILNNKVKLNIGLLVDISYSILPNGNDYTSINIDVSAADYSYNFSNPLNSNIINGSGNNYLTQGILANFLNFKVTSLKVNTPFTITYTYHSPVLNIYSSPTYTTKPLLINNWTQIEQMPSRQQLNANYSYKNLYFKRTKRVPFNFTSFVVCSPTAICITFNGINNNITQLPFNNNSINKSNIYYDITTNIPTFDLNTITNNASILNSSVNINSSNITVFTYKTYPQISNFQIDGNNVAITLYSGINSVIDQIYSGIINNLTQKSSKYDVSLNNPIYDVHYKQPISSLMTINNSDYNIHFKINNAFIPSGSFNISLPSSESTSVTFYESKLNFYNSDYYLVYNKYTLNGGIDYTNLLLSNPDITEVSFIISNASQKNIKLIYNSVNYPITVDNLLDNVTLNDLSGDWFDISLNVMTYTNVGISLTAINNIGKTSLSNLLTYDINANLTNKTLFINRPDIFRVNSILGSPIFRITNSGNIVTSKVTTSMVSLFKQSLNTNDVAALNTLLPIGINSENTLYDNQFNHPPLLINLKAISATNGNKIIKPINEWSLAGYPRVTISETVLNDTSLWEISKKDNIVTYIAVQENNGAKSYNSGIIYIESSTSF